MRFVVISGNIGAGKTTAGRLAALAVDACFVEEPVKLWQESGALEMAYSGMVNAFQPFALASRIFLMKKRIAEYTRLKGKPPKLVLLDRWVWDDLAFASVCLKREDFVNYASYHAAVVAMEWRPVTTIRFNVAVTDCYERIKRRGRAEEAHITLDYLTKIERSLPAFDHEVDGLRLDLAVNEIVAILTRASQ